MSTGSRTVCPPRVNSRDCVSANLAQLLSRDRGTKCRPEPSMRNDSRAQVWTGSLIRHRWTGRSSHEGFRRGARTVRVSASVSRARAASTSLVGELIVSGAQSRPSAAPRCRKRAAAAPDVGQAVSGDSRSEGETRPRPVWRAASGMATPKWGYAMPSRTGCQPDRPERRP